MANYILISAKAEHGKTTVAEILKEQLEDSGRKAYKLAYADHLKDIAKVFFNWDGEKSESGRSLLQSLGDNKGKIKANNKLYYVEHLINLTKCLLDEDDYVLIDDARYDFEIDYVRENLTDKDTLHSIRINRFGFESKLTEEQLKHESEVSLDDYDKFDYHINNVTMDGLKGNCVLIYADIVNKNKTNNIDKQKEMVIDNGN